MARSWAVRAAALALVPLLVAVACTSGPQRHALRLRMGQRPNIVFVLTDDLSWNLVRYMPSVQQLRDDGTTFTNFFVTDSLCCPSRATIFTGRYPHNTKVYSNGGPTGGFGAFTRRGEAKSTFATALQKTGYRTALMGKYLNGYAPRARFGGARPYVAPGWSQWAVTGDGYREYDYPLSVNGVVSQRGHRPQDYLTDVIADRGLRFIDDSVRLDQPFLLELATFAPHLPAPAAPRDAGTFPKVKAPRGRAFNEKDMSDKPPWLRHHRRLNRREIRELDAQFRARVRSVQAVDRMLDRVRARLKARGLDRDTYVVFASDNGLHLGEHRLRQGKMTAFDIDIRVPLVVAGPGVPSGATRREITENTDLCPTFTGLARAPAPGRPVDGRSLVPLLTGAGTWTPHPAALIEHHGPDLDRGDPDAPVTGSGNPPSYEAVRTRDALYAEYTDGEREYYDLRKDPYELDNAYKHLKRGKRTRLARTLHELARCGGKACR